MTKPTITDYHKNLFRNWLAQEKNLKNLMRRFPTKEAPLNRLNDKNFKYIVYAMALENYKEETMNEFIMFLKDEGYLYHDGNIFYSLVEVEK